MPVVALLCKFSQQVTGPVGVLLDICTLLQRLAWRLSCSWQEPSIRCSQDYDAPLFPTLLVPLFPLSSCLGVWVLFVLTYCNRCPKVVQLLFLLIEPVHLLSIPPSLGIFTFVWAGLGHVQAGSHLVAINRVDSG